MALPLPGMMLAVVTPAGERHANAGIVGMDGVDGAQAGLDRTGHLIAVAAPGGRPIKDGDVRVRIHQPGMMTLPAMSRTTAPSGIATLFSGPISTILPL